MHSTTSPDPASAENTPVLYYDGSCRFCCQMVRYWLRACGGCATAVPSQRRGDALPEVDSAVFERTVVLDTGEKRLLTGAEAVFRLCALGGNHYWERLYHKSGAFRASSEWCYRLVSRHRGIISRLSGTRGNKPDIQEGA